MAIHDQEEVSDLATKMSREFLRAKIALLKHKIDEVEVFDDIEVIVPKSVYDVYSAEIEEEDLTETSALQILDLLQKHIDKLAAVTVAHFDFISTTQSTTNQTKEPIMTESTATIHEFSSTTKESTMNSKNTTSETKTKTAKRPCPYSGYKTAGEVVGMVAVTGAAIYGISAVRPIIVNKILDVTGWAVPAATTEVVVTEAAEALATTAAGEGAASFLGGSIELGGVAVPEAALAAAAVIAVAAVGYGGYRYYKSRQAKKAAALSAEKPKTEAEAEAKIDAAVEAVEDTNLKSFLKGLLSGAKSGVKSLKVLAYINVAYILAAVVSGAGFPVIASLIYAAAGLYVTVVISAAIIAQASVVIAMVAVKSFASVITEPAPAAQQANAA